MIYKLSVKKSRINGVISLPASKSISNRMLIIQALCPVDFKIRNISTSDDTKVLIDALKNIDKETFDIGAAGTSMRFLSAYFSLLPGERILTGSARMKQRPIDELVSILQQFGAEIQYLEHEKFPPIKIDGKKLVASPITIRGDISSQFITALLLIAPSLDGHFCLTIENKILSKDYIMMTIRLMEMYGINIVWDDKTIHVNHGQYIPQDISIESDWSSASYWFEMVSLSENSTIELIGLQPESLQGDSVLQDLFQPLGVETRFTNSGIVLKSSPTTCDFFEYDFTSCPDLAQTLAVTLVAKNIPFRLTGLDNLSIKETDRIQALISELLKFGIYLQKENSNILSWAGNETINPSDQIIIETYHDHRMALAFAPLALKTGSLQITNPGVVSKSYPNFWNDLRETGFSITENPQI
ncbi:MAG: 3-phosphoshikimate 1-carboxyvinyltransferase [Bacteroidales bacterium]|nr:3-phosphoshikimate 1-carboxyvinyltransferase [Bacteroidales bacterium]